MHRPYQVITLLAVWPAVAGCPPSRDVVLDAILDGNYCTSADECVRVGSECPFGCDIYVNAAEADEVRELLEGYDDTCEYDCPEPQPAECVDGRCQTEPG